MVFHKRCLWFWAQKHKRRLWKTINAPLCEGGVYGFGVCVYGFLACFVLVDLREVGFALSLLLCGGGWGVWGLRGGVGVGGASPFHGSLGGFPSEGSRMGLLCLLKGGYGG